MSLKVTSESTQQEENPKYSGKLKDSLYWWLGKKRPFIINGEYKLELLFIDKVNCSAKILVTNLKTNETEEATVDGQ